MISKMNQILGLRLIDRADDAVLIIDASSRIRYANAAMSSLSGYPPDGLLNQQLESLLPATVANHHHSYLNAFFEGGRTSTVLGQRRQFAICHLDGSMVPVLLRAFDLGNIGGEPYFGAFLTDLRPQRAIDAGSTVKWKELQKQALSDSLTALPNRRAFEAEAKRAMARSQRVGSELVIGIADLDFFKCVNDRYGHAGGDTVLRTVATILAEEARSNDTVGRIGGEEFGLLFANTNLEQAWGVAERMRCAVAEANIVLCDAQLKITISIGLSPLTQNAKWENALEHADAALYKAKSDGRNRTVLWSEPLGAEV